jgi:riboflavin synthase
MFSWIIEHQARILQREGGKFTIENLYSDELRIGQSIAHDGACMTLTRVDHESYDFFMMQESLHVTNFSARQIWETLNVERCIQIW